MNRSNPELAASCDYASDGRNHLTITSKSNHKDNGGDNAALVNDHGLVNEIPPHHASAPRDILSVAGGPMCSDKGKRRAITLGSPTSEEFASPQWESTSDETPQTQAKPNKKGKSKDKAAAVEGVTRSRVAQMDGHTLSDNSSAIDDLPTQPDMSRFKSVAKSGSHTPSLERLQDRSELATSGDPCGRLRTESPDRKPPANAHPMTPDRTFPIQPVPPLQPYVRQTDFSVRHYQSAGAGAYQANRLGAGPSFRGGSSLVSVETQVFTRKRDMQKIAKLQLGIDRIPSPTQRPTKSLMDQAIGFLFSDKKKLRPNKERDPDEDTILD